MKYENIFWDLFNSHSEIEVDRVIDKYSGLFDNQDNWHPYGDDDSNLKTFTNQQDNAIQPLTEKIINSLDSILIKECKENGYDPEDINNPKTMRGAVEKFYKIKDGEMMHLTPTQRGGYADRIQVIATGEKHISSNPIEKLGSILIYDDGTGQNHKRFEETFLSINGSNKVNIPFVQGKYNMGSTGAVIFCGKKHYQLIGSVDYKDDKREFGFTLIRKHILSENELNRKMTWYEYFRPNNEIPFFKIDSDLDLGLSGRSFKSGTIVKLYSYQLPYGAAGNISTDLYRELNQWMYDLALPYRVIDNRDYSYKTSKNNKVIVGNRNRLNEERHLKLRFSFELDMGDFKIPGQVYVLNLDHKDPREFIGSRKFYKSLQFIINGQVHHYKGKTFMSQDLGFSFLKEHAFVALDFTNVNANVISDLFMANRSNVLKGELYSRIEEKLKENLRSNKQLRAINNEKMQSLTSSSKTGEDVLNDFIKKFPFDKTVSQMLNMGSRLGLNFKNNNNVNNRVTDIKEKPVLQKFPSIFKLKLNKNGKTYKAIPINSKGYVEIETDVSDDYLFRHKEKGNFEIEVLQRRPRGEGRDYPPIPAPPSVSTDIISVDYTGPADGLIRLIIRPTKKAKVGDEISIKAKLSQFGLADDQYFEVIFDVIIKPEVIKQKRDNQTKKRSGIKLPTPTKVYENPITEEDKSWNEYQWNKNDILQVDLGQADDDPSKNVPVNIAVNMDSAVLKNFLNKEKVKVNSESKVKYAKEKYFMSMYFHSFFEWMTYTIMKEDKDERLDEVDIEDLISDEMKIKSNFLIYESIALDESIKYIED
tara:strand:+ start:281 stop:2728 length:2448 start_codon:yes stop_codon:yes gene_type:complete